MKFSSKIEKCNLSPIRKFYPYQVECKKQGKKIYPLNIGQPDIKTPEAYFEAIKNFNAPVLEYAPSPGIPEMIEAVKNYYHGIGIDYETSDIFITTGGSEALQIALNCILDDGDEIIIPEPFYPNYNTFVKTTGGTIRPLTTTPEEGYHYADREKIEALINENTRAIMFTNPGNPTGVVLTPEELKLMVDIAVEHDLFIIGDEVYREFVYGGEPLMSLGQYPEANDNVIIIDSVSKRFSACGARIGTVITRNKELQANMMKICQARLSVATLDQVASAALYSVDPSYFDEVRAEYKERRDTLYNKLMEIPGVVCKEPKGAFYVMAKLPVDDTEKFLVWLLTEFEDNNETVMYAPGGGFYATEGKGTDEVRFAYILKKEDLARAMDLLAMGIKKYNETH
ncbi:MAG: pyridoxal phosphate-dependent aminotransferase [Firmicutes bacterium]|nr:pyridoxal phosphate-dependent aminotransferase [Bacillota bacterium]